jgi:hypothetical protein
VAEDARASGCRRGSSSRRHRLIAAVGSSNRGWSADCGCRETIFVIKMLSNMLGFWVFLYQYEPVFLLATAAKVSNKLSASAAAAAAAEDVTEGGEVITGKLGSLTLIAGF